MNLLIFMDPFSSEQGKKTDKISKSNALHCEGVEIDILCTIQIIGGVLPSGLIIGLRGSTFTLCCAPHSE